MSIKVTDNSVEFFARLSRQQQDILRRAAPRAINRTTTRMRKEMRLRIRERTTIKAAEITKAATIRKASRDKPIGEIVVSKEATSLKRFSVTNPARGLTVRVLKGGGRKLLPGAFGPAFRGSKGRRPRGPVMGGHVYMREAGRQRPTKGYWVRWAAKSSRRKVPLRADVTKLHGPSVWSLARPVLAKMRAEGYSRRVLMEEMRKSLAGLKHRRRR